MVLSWFEASACTCDANAGFESWPFLFCRERDLLVMAIDGVTAPRTWDTGAAQMFLLRGFLISYWFCWLVSSEAIDLWTGMLISLEQHIPNLRVQRHRFMQDADEYLFTGVRIKVTSHRLVAGPITILLRYGYMAFLFLCIMLRT